MTLDLDTIACETCGRTVDRVRVDQRYCSKRCRVAAAVARHRAKDGDQVRKKRLQAQSA